MRILKWITILVGFMAASVASATPAATIRREVPLNTISYGPKGTPLQTGGGTDGIAFDGMQIWVVNFNDDTVQRFDYQSNTLKGTYHLPSGTAPTSVVFDGTFAWVFGDNNGGQFFKFKQDGTLVNGFPMALPPGSGPAWGAVWDGDNIWVGANGGLVRIHASDTARTLFSVPVQSFAPVAFDGRDVWIASANGVAKMDGLTGATIFSTPFNGPTAVMGVAFDGRYVWFPDLGSNFLTKWDPTTNTMIASIPVNQTMRGLVFDGTYLWVACLDPDTVIKVDVHANQIVDSFQFPAGTYPMAAVFDGTHVWVATNSNKLFKFFAKFN